MTNDNIYHGPTVYQAAEIEHRRLGELIEELKDRRKAVLRRMNEYSHSSMLEAEQLATKAEPFQTKQLP